MAYFNTPYIRNMMDVAITKWDLHTADATPKHTIGQIARDNLGRTFRYCHINEDITEGKLVSPEMNSAAVEGWLEEFEDATITGGDSYATSTGTCAAGNTWLRITKATVFDSVVANQFVGCILGEADSGFQYVIKSNTAVSSSMVAFELHEPLKEAMTTATTDLSICPCFVANLVVATAANDLAPIGVLMANVDTSEAPFAWVCTRGPVDCLMDCANAIAAGDMLTLSDDDAGAAQVASGSTSGAMSDLHAECLLGYAIHAPDDQGYGFMMLQGGLD